MCLLVFAWDNHPRYRFVFAGNRDEFHARPARAAGWWNDDMLAGRDELAGGTWLGLHRDGRFAVVTNFREPVERDPDARSRGELVVDYLDRDESALHEIAARGESYAGFNLIAGNLADGPLHYLSNRATRAVIDAGVHGLSNHRLDTPWPKVRRAVGSLTAALGDDEISPDGLLALLANRRPAPAAELPDTGVGESLERLLSPVFIVGPGYGTRCSTVVTLERNGDACFIERRFAPDGTASGESRFQFRLGGE